MLFKTIGITVTPLTATADDYVAANTVAVADSVDSGMLVVTIKSNTGDIDFECFQVDMTGTDAGSLAAYQKTTTICIKDEESK